MCVNKHKNSRLLSQAMHISHSSATAVNLPLAIVFFSFLSPASFQTVQRQVWCRAMQCTCPLQSECCVLSLKAVHHVQAGRTCPSQLMHQTTQSCTYMWQQSVSLHIMYMLMA